MQDVFCCICIGTVIRIMKKYLFLFFFNPVFIKQGIVEQEGLT